MVVRLLGFGDPGFLGLLREVDIADLHLPPEQRCSEDEPLGLEGRAVFFQGGKVGSRSYAIMAWLKLSLGMPEHPGRPHKL